MGQDARVDILLKLKAQLEGFDGAASAVPGLARSVSRAGGEIRQQTQSIGNDVDKMGDRLKKAFDPANLAKGFLAGAGIGSGVALVSLTINKWADVWEESAKHAKELEDRAKGIAEAMQATARAAKEAFIGGLTPQQQLEARQAEAARISANMAALEARRARSLEGIGWLNAKAGNNPLGLSNIGSGVIEFAGERFDQGGVAMGGRTFTELMQKRADEAQLAWTRARDNLLKAQADIAKLQKDLAETAKKDSESKLETTLRHAKLTGRDYDAEKNITPEQMVAAANAAQRAIEEMHKEEMDAALERARLAKLGGARDVMEEKGYSPGQAEDAAEAASKVLGQVSREAKAFDREMAQIWNSVSDRAGQAFADILLDGTNTFADLGKMIIRSIVEVAARMAVINPILNAIFGGFSGFASLPTFFSGGAAAAGGAAGAGTAAVTAAGGGSFLTQGRTNFTVGDNPGGVELVSVLPLSGVGRSSINGRNIAMAGGGDAFVGGGRGGDEFNFHYTFGNGVSRAEMLAIMPQLVEASKSAVLDASRRRRHGFG